MKRNLRLSDHTSSGMLTKRDTAICRLLLETGLRGIDVCSLKLKNIDWERDCISIIQNKTKKALILPLRASYGNDIADYILNERPLSGSDHVFLKTFAPFGHLGTASIYEILKKLEELAGIKKEDRPVGSRMTSTMPRLPCSGQVSPCRISRQLSVTGTQTLYPYIFQRMP